MKTIFKICFILWTALLFSGCAKDETEDTKLQTPYSLKVSSDNVLTWSIVKGAVAYLPNINGVDCETVTSNQLSLLDVVEGGHLSIKVKAIADGTIKQDSDWSEVLEYDMAVILAAPQPVVTGKTVSWEAVEGASGYEYEINGSIVITESTTVDLSEYLAETYTVRVRAIPADKKLNSTSVWSNEVSVAIFDRLATPQLTVNGSSLKNPDAASITWEAVNGASGYEVVIDGVKQEITGTVVDFSGKMGTYNVSVTAVNPELYDASEAAQAVITVRNYGKGTTENPYMIYTAQDWNDFSENVSTNEGVAGYVDKYLELASDIDFENTFVKPAGVSALLSFKGTLDGKNYTLKNAKIGDGTKSHQAFFYLLNGTVKNLNFDNITVTGGNATGANSSAAVITAGNSSVAFTIENCYVNNSKVTSANDGSYAAGIAARCNNVAAIIKNCSISNSTITTSKENAGGIVGLLVNGNIDNVSSLGNIVSAEKANYAGGVFGNITGGKVSSITAMNNTVSAISYAGGVSGALGASTIVNIVSIKNISTVQKTSSGGVIGVCTSADAKIINVLSDRNTVKCLQHSYAPYLGLIMGGHKDMRLAYLIANTLTLAGNVEYVFDSTDATKTFAAAIGIVMGDGVNAVIQSGYYLQNNRSHYDVPFYEARGTNASTINGCRFAVGVLQSTGTADSKAGKDMEFSAQDSSTLTNGSVLTLLNSWIESNKETYTSLKTWTTDDNGYPKL